MVRKPNYQRGIRAGRIRDWPPGVGTPDEVAERVSYTGSSVHKTYPSPAGPPANYADKAKCDEYPPDSWPLLLDALRQGIRAGVVSEFRGEFPARIWVRINGILHEARLTSATGDYHGFPLRTEAQYPEPLNRLLATPDVEIPVV